MILLAVPIVLWGIANYLIDPFNYFNHSVVSNESKSNAEQLNTLMYRTYDFLNSPSENLLIGDSRTDALPIDRIEELAHKKFKKLNSNAAKLNEIIALFYLANDAKPLKEVVIGVNFNMYNKYGYRDRVQSIRKTLSNPFLYLYNGDVSEASFQTLNQLITENEISFEPEMTREEFWNWNIETKAMHWYGKYQFPAELEKELRDLDLFAQEKNINLTFIITPHYKKFHDRLVDFNLVSEEEAFKDFLSSLNANVYDYDFPNAMTNDSTNFNDPVHYNDSCARIIVDEIWSNNLKIGRKLP